MDSEAVIMAGQKGIRDKTRIWITQYSRRDDLKILSKFPRRDFGIFASLVGIRKLSTQCLESLWDLPNKKSPSMHHVK